MWTFPDAIWNHMYETRLSTALQDTSWFGKGPKVLFGLFFSLVFLFYVFRSYFGRLLCCLMTKLLFFRGQPDFPDINHCVLLFYVRLEGYQESRNESGSLFMTEYQLVLVTFQFLGIFSKFNWFSWKFFKFWKIAVLGSCLLVFWQKVNCSARNNCTFQNFWFLISDFTDLWASIISGGIEVYIFA